MTARCSALADRIALAWLRRNQSPAGDGLTGLAVTGVATGREYRFPVLATTGTESDPQLVVLSGDPRRASWWRNLDASGSPVDMRVLHRGRWRPASGTVLKPVHPDYPAALATYLECWPDAQAGDRPLVVISRGSRTEPSSNRSLVHQGRT